MSAYEEIKNLESYLKLFKNKEETLKYILEIRKFEIELYWKRTTFFWTILAAIIAGYFLIYSKLSTLDNNSLKLLFVLGCLGLIFSIGWYFVNRGSKFWQVNWEKHLYCIEDEAIGPLSKTTIDTNYYRKRFFYLASPYPFSVTKINHILNIVLIVFWLGLLFDFCITHLTINDNYLSFYFWTGVFTLAAIFSLFVFTHTGIDNYFGSREKREKRRVIDVVFEKRGINEKTK